MSISSIEKYSFAYLMSQALAQVPDSVDKRQGSIIYDALAPACYVLADFYMQLRNVYIDTYIETATGEALEMRVAERGVSRYSATSAVKKGVFADSLGDPLVLRIGDRFSTISDTSPLVYQVLGDYEVDNVAVPGAYLLTCETTGTVGNGYTGNLLNISYVRGIATAVMSTLVVSARDVETDTELRSRYLQVITETPFGGNVAQYRLLLKELEGVGDVQVYPVWDGGGTVKCSIISPANEPVSVELLASVQQIVDPLVGGTGLGLAPIGHAVTIVTASELTIAIGATVTLIAGFTLAQIQTPVEIAIQAYIDELKEQWGTPSETNTYSLSVYLSKIIVCILSVAGVSNVSGVTINTVAADKVLTENSTTQQIPVLGGVTLS